MSTIKVTNIQHPSAVSPSIELSADGTIVLPLSGIGDLADVDEGSGAVDGDVLTYDGTGDVWVPQSIPSPEVIAGIGSNVVQTVKTNVFSTASSSFVDVTGLTATITPSSDSSKILVAWSVVISNTANLGATHILITDGSDVALLQGDAAGSRERTTQGEQRMGDAGEAHVFSGFFLWSPATASAVTAKVRIRAGNNTALVNRTGLDTDSAIGPRTTSSITLMEVAA